MLKKNNIQLKLQMGTSALEDHNHLVFWPFDSTFTSGLPHANAQSKQSIIHIARCSVLKEAGVPARDRTLVSKPTELKQHRALRRKSYTYKP